MINKIRKAIWLMNKDNFENAYMKKVLLEMSENDRVRNTHNKKNYLSLSSEMLNEIMLNTVIRSKKLLEEKGFPNTLHAKLEKHVLLGTEISELADAVKKGKGVNEEGEELADIVIRLSNFLCADETYDQYIKLSQVFWSYEDEFSNMLNVETHEVFKYPVREIDMKYGIIQQMMIRNESVRITADNYVDLGINNADPVPLISLWYACLRLLGLCYAYADAFLPESLHFYIDEKMEKNFKRPFRYNTCEDFNK